MVCRKQGAYMTTRCKQSVFAMQQISLKRIILPEKALKIFGVRRSISGQFTKLSATL
jgi:hypothetical protein